MTYYLFDPNGNVTDTFVKLDAATWARSQSYYDKLDRQKGTIDPENNETYFVYDQEGNTTAVVDPLQKASYFVYDELNCQVAATNPLEETTYFDYDENGNQTAVVAPGAEGPTVVHGPFHPLASLRVMAGTLAPPAPCRPLSSRSAATPGALSADPESSRNGRCRPDADFPEMPSMKTHGSGALSGVSVLWVLACLGGCMHTAGRPYRINLLQPAEDAKGAEKQLIEWEAEYDRSNDPREKQAIRDKFARKMIAVIDHKYNNFLDDMVWQRKGFDATTDVAAISLDTAAVLLSPATTKSILAGLSGLTTAAKTATNRVYFYEQALPVLISQMAADRQVVLAQIQERLTADVTGYPLHRLLSDLQRYYSVGTIDGALENIQRQAAAKRELAEQKMLKQAEADVSAARIRHEAALALTKDKASFDNLKSLVSEWWSKLEEDVQWEQVEVIGDFAKSHQVDIGPLQREKDGKRVLHPDGMGTFLDSLDHNSQAARLMLADIARNAAKLELP